jgi:hypothetical protein
VVGPLERPMPDSTAHSQQTLIHAPSGIRTCNPSKRPTALPQRSAVLMNCELEMIIKELVVACVKLSPRIVRMRVGVLEHGVSKR